MAYYTLNVPAWLSDSDTQLIIDTFASYDCDVDFAEHEHDYITINQASERADINDGKIIDYLNSQLTYPNL